MLRSDRGFRAFHEGRSDALPEFYRWIYERALGVYAELVSRRKRIPILEPAASHSGRVHRGLGD